MRERIGLVGRYLLVAVFAVAAFYAFMEWWYFEKTKPLAVAAPVGSSIVVTNARAEPALQVVDVEAAQHAVLEQVARHEKQAGRLVLEIERLQRQVRVLSEQLDSRDRQLVALQRAMEALKGQVVPVVSDAQLVSLAKEFGFTKIQVRP